MSTSHSKSQQSSADFKSLMSCVSSNKENFDFLIRLMRRNVVIPFIGAGLSANFGYPTWAKFLEDQANIHHLQEVKTAQKNHEYEKAATLLDNHLLGNMEYALMQSFGDHIYKTQSNIEELDLLPKIFRNLILTTNFDEVIELLYAKVNGEHIDKLTPRTLGDVTLAHKRIACGEPTLIKLHGDVASREFVLTEHAYNNVYGKHILDVRLPLPSFLRDVLLSRVILFLGCGLEDDRTLQVIEQSQIDGSISFALLELPKETANTNAPWEPILTETKNGIEQEKFEFAKRKAFLYAHNIIPIWFPYEKYDALKIFLTTVASQISSEYSFSITGAQVRVNNLLNNGAELGYEGNIENAFRCYTNALEIVKINPEAFNGKKRLDALNTIKAFYDLNGYGFECKEIIKEAIDLTGQLHADNSIELAKCYHDIGYTYERYHYYTLMQQTMQRSQEILRKYEEKSGKDDAFLDAATFIYIGLGYAFYKNNNTEGAKKWYKEAETLLQNFGHRLNNKARAFLYNGLHRYYRLTDDHKQAISTLEEALKIRKGLYVENHLVDSEARDILNHIFNTHSNKIRIYLDEGKYDEAEREFQTCRNAYPIWNRPEYLRDAKHRILTDHGNILMKLEDYQGAYNEYTEALKYRKYLHFIDDIWAADLYLKVAESLKNIQGRSEEAMEYLIQAYVIYEKSLDANQSVVSRIREDHMEELYNRLSFSDEALEQRLSAQREFLRYRHDERLDNLEDELIKYFNL